MTEFLLDGAHEVVGIDNLNHAYGAWLKERGLSQLGGTLSEIVRQIGQLTGREPIIEDRDSHRPDMPATGAHVDKAQELLGLRW